MAASATATLSLCSSFATHCKISQNLQTPSTHFSFPSLSLSSSHKLSSSSSRRPTFPLLTKSSESDSALVVEAEFQAPEPGAGPNDSEPAALQVVETPSSEAPKREQLFAVVMTVFADRISVFRRACCELFGYKIVMDEHQRPNGIPVTRFTLQSIYAQSDDEKLEFEYESGSTNILANDYTSQSEISQQVEIFVRKLNSIPAFTANLTVESFNRRTLT